MNQGEPPEDACPPTWRAIIARHLPYASRLSAGERRELEGIRDPAEGENVLLHELAHQLDFEDGADDGVPRHDDAAIVQEMSTRNRQVAKVPPAEW